ncbi:MAG: hypothetical protein NTW71_12665, partial [Deltaproteobacteria bacterium]|nr:hypothetical protein [Deltaproteobacteria bacterium]
MKIVIPPRAGYFSTLRLLALLREQGAPKNSNARFRDPIPKLRKGGFYMTVCREDTKDCFVLEGKMALP